MFTVSGQCNVWEAFDEINTKTVFGEPIRFDNLLFKHDVKIVPTSKRLTAVRLRNVEFLTGVWYFFLQAYPRII